MDLRTKAFFTEFPFLNLVTSPQRFDSVSVSRIDHQFLNMENKRGRLPKNIFLFSKDGDLLCRVGFKKIDPPKWWQFWASDHIGFKETVGEASARLSETELNRVHFAGVVESYDAGDDGAGRMICVLKPPKSFTLTGWLDETLRLQRTEVASEADSLYAKS